MCPGCQDGSLSQRDHWCLQNYEDVVDSLLTEIFPFLECRKVMRRMYELLKMDISGEYGDLHGINILEFEETFIDGAMNIRLKEKVMQYHREGRVTVIPYPNPIDEIVKMFC